MTPGAYNNNVQIFQTARHVALLNEMVHDVRIIPLDGRPHLPPHLRQWKGDSRGRWDGDTLVVDTINFAAKRACRGSTATRSWSSASRASTPTRSATNSRSTIRRRGRDRGRRGVHEEDRRPACSRTRVTRGIMRWLTFSAAPAPRKRPERRPGENDRRARFLVKARAAIGQVFVIPRPAAGRANTDGDRLREAVVGCRLRHLRSVS